MANRYTSWNPILMVFVSLMAMTFFSAILPFDAAG